MTIEKADAMTPEQTLALAASLGLPLAEERAPHIAGVLHHIRSVIARLDELPIEYICPPSFAFNAQQENAS
ncbi:hypothetical protein [Halomonas dongshanensis]|uniref:DUF4089 domain-containing protein n=1 Tax=Halomonas dongshanensis TaxID=2890835 RepID=A0ABT2EAE1_9GAMM|nr:hypothetical protein [Halomonas dongshanensis]MCS2608531.1 hypothetical protein [Halomonas dongshanensis]